MNRTFLAVGALGLVSVLSQHAYANCASNFSNAQEIIKEATDEKIRNGTTYIEKATDGRPLRIVFSNNGGMSLTVIRSNGSVYGPYPATICAQGEGQVTAQLQNSPLGSSPVSVTKTDSGTLSVALSSFGTYEFVPFKK